ELGTDEQKAKYLPRILAGEDYWTQGYSEPNSGSDLASLSCRAEVDGDDYIINGSKIWTTLAHKSNRMFMLVRTSSAGKKQHGITFLLLDRTDYEGMEIRPIIGLDGEPECCEVFFDNVRVPQSGRIGAENAGWSVSKQLLQFERGVTASSPAMQQRVKRIRAAAKGQNSPFGGRLADDPAFQTKLGELEAEVATLEQFEKLAISGHEIGQDPALASISKVVDSELTQKISAMMKYVSGLDAVSLEIDALKVGSARAPLGSAFDLVSMPYYLNSRATTIYAGSNEVQRDLIARTLLK
ncbi:MAG: acyl-CoA dehydrogenase family protein, partial [Pseudomonadota bacterium]